MDNNFCNCDNLNYVSTPSPDWTCADWVIWHKDLLAAYQDGRLGRLTKDKALDETNRVFAMQWEMNAGFSKKFWGTCGYEQGFFNYFKSIGYTDHISFIAGAITPLLGGVTDLASGTGDLAGGVSDFASSIGKNLFLYLLILVIVYALIQKV